MDAYRRRLDRLGLLTREGEQELARRRDRGWAVARGVALASADTGAVLDRLLADHLQTPDDERLRHRRARELEQLRRWREVHDRCREAVAARDWARACAAADQLRSAVGSIPLDVRGWQCLSSGVAEALAEALMLDEHEDAKLVRYEQRLGHPRWRWVDLCEDIIAGEREAKQAVDEIVEANLRLVLYVGRRYRRQSMVPFSDLVQEGNLGLIIAAEKFDPRRGFRFASMAKWWIRCKMTRLISNHGRTVRLTSSALSKLAKLERVRAAYRARERAEPTAEQLGQELGVPVDRVRFLLSINHQPRSLEDSEDDERPLSEVLVDPSSVNPIEWALELEHLHEAQELLEGLDALEQQVLRLRFGFEGAERTRRAVARELAISLKQVRELEQEALLKLRGSRSA